MSREVDVRDFSVNRENATRRNELKSLALEASFDDQNVRIERFDPVTGNPSVIRSDSTRTERGNYVQRALDYAQSTGRVRGLSESQPAEFMPDPHVQETSTGAAAVNLQQTYKGIKVFQAAETVRFSPDGTLTESVGNTVSVPEDLPVAPKLRVEEAVLKAADHVAVPSEDEQGKKDQFGEPTYFTAVDLTGFEPHVTAMFTNTPEQPTVLEKGPFGDSIKANLVWFPLGDELRLAWEVILTMPNYEGQYRVMVDAETGEILYSHQLISSIRIKGSVFRKDGAVPRDVVDFPLAMESYGIPDPREPLPSGTPSFPADWVLADSTEGTNVYAHLGVNGPTVKAVNSSGSPVFDNPDPNGDYQKVLNIFYYCNFMHDFLYLLGFREKDGNFQQENFGRGGLQGDRVDARAHSGAVSGTANMGTPVDGHGPVMNMGLVTSTNRHTAMDSSVVFHEYTHGLTNRLVGGPMNDAALDAPQSSGMGEGWSDYVACTINNTEVVGDWVVNNPDGIREFHYDSNFPDNFGNIGTGRYDEEHNIGEIWCAILMEMNRKVGKELSLQLVVDALKLTPANPSFIDARDAILRAAGDMLTSVNKPLSQEAYDRANAGIWAAFAKFGVGTEARSNGASLSGIVPSFKVPEQTTHPGEMLHFEADPNLAVPDNQPTGITSIINVPQDGKVAQIEVAVKIDHTYIGDLQVKLVSPEGDAVMLHDRNRARTVDLDATYSSRENQALANLVGSKSKGNWTLSVVDLAKRDLGTLRHWGLDIELAGTTGAGTQSPVKAETEPGLDIPDNEPGGVNSTISIDQPGTTQGIKIGVDITHTYIGDLRLELLSPSGKKAVLHNREGEDRDNLIATYDSSSPALSGMLGQEMKGNWTLKVADLAGQDVGKFNKWSLELL